MQKIKITAIIVAIALVGILVISVAPVGAQVEAQFVTHLQILNKLESILALIQDPNFGLQEIKSEVNVKTADNFAPRGQEQRLGPSKEVFVSFHGEDQAVVYTVLVNDLDNAASWQIVGISGQRLGNPAAPVTQTSADGLFVSIGGPQGLPFAAGFDFILQAGGAAAQGDAISIKILYVGTTERTDVQFVAP